MSLIEKTGVNDVYQKIAQNFSDKRYNQWSWITEFINEANKYPHRKNVLDVGCGNGRNMEGWINASVYGLDKCREFIKMCIQKDKDVVEADMTAIPFQKDFFDFIISVASFHHLSTEVRRVEALSEMRRVIKPNGKLLLSVWSRKQPPKTKQAKTINKYGDIYVEYNDKGNKYDRYYHIFKLEKLQQLFKATGWKVETHFWDYGNEVFVLST